MKIIDDWFDKQFKKMAKLRESLDKPDRLMKKIGALAVGESQKAFENQALGNIQWPERYPGMKPPFLNVAGALQDFNAGRKAPKPNRFQDRPALVDEGQRGGIWGSLTFKLTGNHSVEAGSNKPYANTHQEGAERGENFIPVTETAREGIRNWLYNADGSIKGKGEKGFIAQYSSVAPKSRKTLDWFGKAQKFLKDYVKEIKATFKWLFVPEKSKASVQPKSQKRKFTRGREMKDKSGYVPKLKPLLSELFYTQKILARPFVGVTDDFEQDAIAETKDFFERI